MSDNSFDDMVCKMREYLKGLGKCKPFTRDGNDDLRRDGKALPEVEGVYCFYEDGKALYVGRTDNIRKRVLQHCRPRGRQNSAALAFNIAKKELAEDHPNEEVGRLSRGELSQNPTFAPLFTKAKERVRRMSVRYVKIQDSNEQAVFEVYAHMKLGTPFNDFSNH